MLEANNEYEYLQSYPLLKNRIVNLKMSKDVIAFTTSTQLIIIKTDGFSVKNIPIPKNQGEKLAISSDSKYIAFVGHDRYLRIIDIQTEVIRQIKLLFDICYSLYFFCNKVGEQLYYSERIGNVFQLDPINMIVQGKYQYNQQILDYQISSELQYILTSNGEVIISRPLQRNIGSIRLQYECSSILIMHSLLICTEYDGNTYLFDKRRRFKQIRSIPCNKKIFGYLYAFTEGSLIYSQFRTTCVVIDPATAKRTHCYKCSKLGQINQKNLIFANSKSIMVYKRNTEIEN